MLRHSAARWRCWLPWPCSPLTCRPVARRAWTPWRRCGRNRRPVRLHGVTTFPPPDFNQPKFANVPDARFAPAPADGVLPDGFFSTTNFPTFVRLNGTWRAPREPRMDAGLVLQSDGTLWVREGRRLKRGDMVA